MSPVTVEGRVLESHSAWTPDGEQIVTHSTIATAGGEVTVLQFGGSVDGIGMRTFPGPDLLDVGATVAVVANPSFDLLGNKHLVVEKVRVLAEPATFVRSGPTRRGNPLYWESGCVTLVPDVSDLRTIDADAALRAIDAAVAEWNTRTAECSYIHLSVTAPLPGEARVDKINRIKFREDEWCRPATFWVPKQCHADEAVAITKTKFVDDVNSGRDGALIDADVELNGTGGNQLGVDAAPLPDKCVVDVQATLTHELGHLLGLGHPCINNENDRQPTDSDGNPVPACQRALDPPEMQELTMYNFQDCGERIKATLTDRDVDAICTIYPRGPEAPVACATQGVAETPSSVAGCAAADAPGALVIALALVPVLARHRRAAQRKDR